MLPWKRCGRGNRERFRVETIAQTEFESAAYRLRKGLALGRAHARRSSAPPRIADHERHARSGSPSPGLRDRPAVRVVTEELARFVGERS